MLGYYLEKLTVFPLIFLRDSIYLCARKSCTRKSETLERSLNNGQWSIIINWNWKFSVRDPAKATMDRAANAPRDKASESDGAIERATGEHGGPASLPRGSGDPDALHDPSVRGQEDEKDEQLTDALVSKRTDARARSDRIRKNDAEHAERCRRKRWRAELRAKIVAKKAEKVAKLIDAMNPETVAAIIAAERAAEIADAQAIVDAARLNQLRDLLLEILPERERANAAPAPGGTTPSDA